jgi:hypothetical protein
MQSSIIAAWLQVAQDWRGAGAIRYGRDEERCCDVEGKKFFSSLDGGDSTFLC